MRIEVDTSAFEADIKSLLADIGSDGFEAFRKAASDAAESTTEHNYKNRTGHLTDSRETLCFRTGTLGWQGKIEWRAKYAKFVDEPTKAHAIVAKKAKFLRFYVGGEPVFRKRVWHPGTAGSRFSNMAALTFAFEAPGKIQAGVDTAISKHP